MEVVKICVNFGQFVSGLCGMPGKEVSVFAITLDSTGTLENQLLSGNRYVPG